MGEFVKVAKTSDIPAGAARAIQAQGHDLAVFNIGGVYYAIGNGCTHVGGPLVGGKIFGNDVACPWHGARFKIPTGEVVCGPARSGVASHNVRVVGDDIEVEM
jgi:nitrite reductase/ring-hydroxylating ferredoxin subunit